MKNILICNNQVPYTKGGAEILVEELNKQLKNRGYNSDIINIPYKWYPAGEIINGALVNRMIDLTEVNGEKIDLVICTKYPNYTIKHPNKVIWLLHQERQAYELFDFEYSILKDNPEGRKVRDQIVHIDNKAISEAKKIFSISKNVTKRLYTNNEIESEVLYPPVSGEFIISENEMGDYFVTISRLDKLKRIDLIVEAMRYTKSNAKLIVAGKGNEREYLESMIKKYKLQNKVLLKGYVSEEEKVELYTNSIGVVFVPKDEDYGYITIEAYLSGRPVITALDSGGPLEFVEDGETGYIVSPEPQKIAQKIDSLFNDKDKARKFGKLGYEKVKNINWDNVIEKLVK